MAVTHFSGPVAETGTVNSQEAARSSVRSMSVFLLPNGSGTTFVGPFRAVSGTWTQSYVTGPITQIRRTASAAAQIYQMIFSSADLGINVNTDAVNVQIGEQPRGARITSLDLVYQLTTGGPLDAHTATLATLTWVDNVAAPTAVSRPITGTLAVAVRANPYITRLTVTTPFVAAGSTSMVFEVTVDGDAGAAVVYDFFGLGVNYDLLL